MCKFHGTRMRLSLIHVCSRQPLTECQQTQWAGCGFCERVAVVLHTSQRIWHGLHTRTSGERRWGITFTTLRQFKTVSGGPEDLFFSGAVESILRRMGGHRQAVLERELLCPVPQSPTAIGVLGRAYRRIYTSNCAALIQRRAQSQSW